MNLEIIGVPKSLANTAGIITPGGTREAVPEPQVPAALSPVVTNAQAHAALKALAIEDGWWALYDPTNSASLTKDTSGNVTAIADSLGNGPTLTLFPGSTAVPTRLLGSLNALGALYGAPLDAVGYFAATVWTGMSSVYFSSPSAVSALKPYVQLSSGSVTSAGSTADTSRTIPYAVGGTSSDAVAPVVMGFDSRSNDIWLGEHLAPYDTDPTDRDVSTPGGIIFGCSPSSSAQMAGPLVLAQDQPGEDARLRMTRLLTQLSGAMTTIGDVGGLNFDSYATVDESGKLVAGFRPWKPVQTASVIKALMAYVARKFVTDAMLNTSVAVVDPYQPTDNRFPSVFTGDTLTWRDLFTITNHVSHNRLSSTIAYHAEKLRNPTGTGTTEQIIGRFLTHVKSVCTGFGWTEAVIGTPNGYRDCILSTYHAALLFQKIRAEDPWLTTMMGTPTASFTINHITRGETPAWVETGTVTNIVHKSMGGNQYQELIMGKGGTLASPSLATLATLWRDPATGQKMASMYSSGPGGNADDRHLGTRITWDATRNRYTPPQHWSSPGAGSQTLWGNDGTSSFAALTRDPNSAVWEDYPALLPFNTELDPLPIVRAGDTVTVTAQVKRPYGGGAGANRVVSMRIAGGEFAVGGDEVLNRESIATDTATGWITVTITGTVVRGGVLTPSVYLENASDDAAFWVRRMTTTVVTPAGERHVYRMPLETYSVTQDSQPLDLSNSSGGVGGFTAEVRRPELASIFSRYGHRYLNGKRCRLLTNRGTFHGTITNTDLSNRVAVSIDGVTTMGALNAFNVEAPPFSGTLGGLIQTYFGLISESAPEYTIDTDLSVIPVLYPGWSGDLWPKLKDLCAAHEMQIYPMDDGSIHFAKALGDEYTPGGVASISETGEPQSLARSVEVVKYTYREVNKELVYPPGGWGDDVEVITVSPGQVVEYTLELGGTYTSIETPQHVPFVDKLEYRSSVYSIVDETGRTVSPETWKTAGGSVTFTLAPDGRSIRMLVVAPGRVMLDSINLQIGSYAIGSRFGDASSQYSTLRILGTGIEEQSETLNFATGVTKELTGSEVGTTIDNMFVSTMAQAGAAGMRAALTFSGNNASVKLDGQSIPPPGAHIQDTYRDYRQRTTTVTPEGVSVDADYYLTTDEHSAGFDGMTYDQVKNWYEGLSYSDAQNRGKKL